MKSRAASRLPGLSGTLRLVASLSRSAIRHPFRALAIALLATLAAAPGLLRLELRTDGHALVPRRDPAVVYDREVRAAFGVRDPVVAVIRTGHPAGVFNPGTLRRVRDLTAALQQLEGVGAADLLSLATEHTFRFRPGSLRLRTFLETPPETPEQIARVRDDLRRIGLYDGVLVSADGRATAVMVGAPAAADRAAFHRAVRAAAAGLQGGGDTVEVIGAPVAEALLGNHILADLGLPRELTGEEAGGRRSGLVPLVFAVMALVFLIAFRHPFAALAPLATIAACLVTTFGLMGWLGVPVYLTTTVLPVILTAVGVTDQVHVYHRYAALRRGRPELDPAALAAATMDEMAWPVAQTWVTTAVGFLSFALSPLPPVQAFGLFAAVGIFVCLGWSLGVVPALLVLLRPALGPSPRSRPGPDGGFGRLARFAARRRRLVLAGAALLALAAADGVRRLAVQDSWVDGFAPGSGFARAMRSFDRQFLGAHQLLVTVEAEPLRFAVEIPGDAVGERSLALPAAQLPPGLDPARLTGSWVRVSQRPSPDRPSPAASADWSGSIASARREGDALLLELPLKGGSPRFWLAPRPDDRLGVEVWREPFMVPGLLRQVAGIETFLASRPGVGGVLGPAKYLSTVAFMLRPDDPESRRLPDEPERARSLWSHYGRVRGPERLRQLVDPEYSQVVVTAFLEDSNYAATARILDDLRAYERERLASQGLRLGFAGDVAVSQTLIGAIVTTQVRSLALSLAGIFALTALLGRSWRRGLLCVLPPGFAVLLSFAAMGWLGIPLGVATSMFAGMTLGVGVDYVVHLLERRRRALAAGLTGEAALADALAATGPAIAIDTLAVGLAFSVLLLSQVPANACLGGLLALSLAVCLAATLLVIPALLARSKSSGSLF
jgi:predicted RND superfamily exporter protein